MPDDIRNVWQNQEQEAVIMSLDELRRRSRKLQTRVGRRNLREYGGAIAVVAYFGWQMTRTHDPAVLAAFALIMAGVLYVAFRLHRDGAARAMPADAARISSLAFHRAEIERQRDLLAGVWRWYLGPLIPGLALLTLLGALRGHSPYRYWFAVSYAAVVAVAFWFIGRLNRRGADKLQRQIDELKAQER